MTEETKKYQVGGDHYRQMSIEPWDIYATWPIGEHLAVLRGNALKYIMRAGHKGDMLQDLKKAEHYIRRMIEVVAERENRE